MDGFKKPFWQFFVQKDPFVNFSIGTFEPMHETFKKMPKSIPLKIFETGNKKKIQNFYQGQANSEFMQ